MFDEHSKCETTFGGMKNQGEKLYTYMRFAVSKKRDRQRIRITKRGSLKVRINSFNFFRDSLELFYLTIKLPL